MVPYPWLTPLAYSPDDLLVASSTGISYTSDAEPNSTRGAGVGARAGAEDTILERAPSYPRIDAFQSLDQVALGVWRYLTGRYPPPPKTLSNDSVKREPQSRFQSIYRDVEPSGERVIRSLPRLQRMQGILPHRHPRWNLPCAMTAELPPRTINVARCAIPSPHAPAPTDSQYEVATPEVTSEIWSTFRLVSIKPLSIAPGGGGLFGLEPKKHTQTPPNKPSSRATDLIVGGITSSTPIPTRPLCRSTSVNANLTEARKSHPEVQAPEMLNRPKPDTPTID
ncbi:hypothetical protein BHM03_00011853 [Ensete ventricosum]|nr:hypothetical protein BHM03_00011853 [Ensete ventricosum]